MGEISLVSHEVELGFLVRVELKVVRHVGGI